MKKENTVLCVILLSGIIGILSVFLYHANLEINGLERNLKLYYKETYGEDYDNDGIVDGLYKGDHFTIWLPGNDYARVMEVCNHEWLHYTRDNYNYEENFSEHFD